MTSVIYQGKTWDKEAICALLDRSDDAVARALQTIYARQTEDERAVGETRHHNSVGFTGRDANWLSDIAEKYRRYGRWASQRQVEAVRRAIKKYHRQLLDEIAAKEGAMIVKRGRVVGAEIAEDAVIDPGNLAEEIMAMEQARTPEAPHYGDYS